MSPADGTQRESVRENREAATRLARDSFLRVSAVYLDCARRYDEQAGCMEAEAASLSALDAAVATAAERLTTGG